MPRHEANSIAKPALTERIKADLCIIGAGSCSLSVAAAVAAHKVKVLRWPYHENDRAQAEEATEGLVKVVTDMKGRMLGAGIVGG